MGFQDLKEAVGKKIYLTGQLSEIMWQHMIGYEKDYPQIQYFDLDDENYQIVLYLKDEIPFKKGKQVKVFGEIVEISGGPKNPEERRKIDSPTYREYHMKVESYEYVN